MDGSAMAQNSDQAFEQQVSESSPAASQADDALDLIEFTLDETADGYCIIAADTAISGDLVIPDQYNGRPVVRSAERAFYNCEADEGPEGWAENWIESSQTVYWGS